MDIAAYQWFITVVRHLSISEAARELHLSQPTLSRSISQLEKELGQKLFIRSRPLRLTPAGKLALGQAYALWQNYQDLQASMKTISKGLSGSVRVQNITHLTSGMNIMMGIMMQMDEQYPNVTVEIINCQQKDLLRELKEGRLDVAFFWVINDMEPTDPDGQVAFQNIGSYDNEMFMCVENDHPLLERQGERELVLSDLQNECFIRPLNSENEYLYSGFIELCRRNGFEPRFEVFASQDVQDYFTQRLKGRISFFSRSMLEQISIPPNQQEHLKALKVSDTRLILRLFCAYMDDLDNEAALTLISLLV